ncbi:hypothetical protein RD792_016852 [Penstemon davidsonii]|uniref:Cullin family profile domain-containing protein n=1 Tax=Penstemon davidsonii TaxID=160366 RepID=A0ABR0CLE0_9LAMI|nr:hypothetical protein RD792_016852 [Penstemon davidsonii]
MRGEKKRNFSQAFNHRVPVDPEKTWKILEDAIDEIYNQNVSILSYEVLHRNAYNMVLHNFGDKLYSGVVSSITSHLKEIADSMEIVEGPIFLEKLIYKWTEHNKAVQLIQDIMMYMERTYVKYTHKPSMHELGLNLWRENVIYSEKIQTRLRDKFLGLVHCERGGDVINRGLMRSLTKMLMDLCPSVYQENFEKPFLDESADFYRAESQQCIEHFNCGEYLKKAEKRLNEEIERVSNYLDVKTEAKIVSLVEKEMIESHIERLVHMENSGLVSMIMDDDKLEDLSRMYTLFGKLPNGHTIIRDVMTSHIRETGKDLVMDQERLKDPVNFVQDLLNKTDRVDKIISLAFNNDKAFQNAINSSFRYFINLNPRLPEFISLFVDEKIRNGLKTDKEVDIETVFDKVMILFRYLEEKDIFEKYYKQHLARRLLLGKMFSEDAERSFIVKLKMECGHQFTSKLEGMLTDIKTSQHTMQRFNAAMSGAQLTDCPSLSVQILTTGCWPTQSSPSCSLPLEILKVCDKFKNFYLGTHMGRKLTWQTHMGTAVLSATFGNVQKELIVSTYQMSILYLFNYVNRVSFKQIECATKIPSSDLKRCLQSLACVMGKNVLRKDPMSKDIGDDDSFYFNDKFTSKMYRVKIGTAVSEKESEQEMQETRLRLEGDRRHEIESAIVRVMKSRRVLDYNSIVTEVTNLLQSRFLPNPTVIKKRIESLIEREYLERDKTDMRFYRYLA